MTASRILIVEDERIVALNLQQRLTKLGYEVVGRAASGLEAIANARETKPDLVLMDIHIEGPTDGIETAKKLIDELQLRVIYLTAYSEDSTLERARATQPYGYLLKPFSERELHATLQMALERRAADLALVESEERARLALQTASMGSWEFSPSRSELRTYGLAAELIGAGGTIRLEALLACVHPDDRAQAHSAVERAAAGGTPCSVEFRQLRPGQPLRWIRIVARVFKAGPLAEPRLIGIVQDVTERRAAESRLRQAATLFEESHEGLFILDGDRRLVTANPAFTLMTGLDPDQHGQKELAFLTTRMLPVKEFTELWDTLKQRKSWHGELKAMRPNGDLFPARLSLSWVEGDASEGVQLVGILSDFTELRAAQDQLRQLAHYDPLTGLPNRLLMQDRLTHALERAHRHNGRVAILFLDLDHFKRINDTRGHATGDLVLREMATKLTSQLRRDDTAARLGGDEFVVLLEDFSESSHVINVAEKLRTELTLPLTINGSELQVGTSIGIAVYPEDGDTAAQLLQCADTAMYEAKSRGRNAYAFYNAGMTVRVARYLARDQRLRQALTNKELTLHYQPQVDTALGQCVALEALIRWEHPELGLLGAAEVMPSAEESGLILDIGRWALMHACQQARAWQDAGLPPVRIAVNVSSRQMQNGALAADIESALKTSGLNPSSLEIEITETSLQTESIAVATLHRIRALGVSIAIDDFGTGYSCLASLKNLPINRLKIDRSFVKDLPDDRDSAALAHTILSIASAMNLKVTAEGVETEAQKQFFSIRGCRDIQGFLYSPAVEASAVPAMLKRLSVAA